MTIAAGPFVLGAMLLVVGGVLKAARPNDTANALRAVGSPSGVALVRLGAVLEAGVGVYALARGDRLAAVLVAGSYLLFVAFVGAALLRGAPVSSCGCFGRVDTPPTLVHVVVNLGIVAAALAVVAEPGVAIADVVAEQPLAGIPFCVLVVTGVLAVFLAFSTLPRTLALVRQRQAS